MRDKDKIIVGEVKGGARWHATLLKIIRTLLAPLKRLPKPLKIALLIGLLMVTGLASWQAYSALNQRNIVCSDEILQEATNSLGPAQAAVLKETVTKIQTIQGYEKDPNCLYPIVIYYINTSDYNNAKLYMDMLEKRYNPKQQFSSKLGTDAKSLETLRVNVDFLRVLEDNFKQNRKFKLLNDE